MTFILEDQYFGLYTSNEPNTQIFVGSLLSTVLVNEEFLIGNSRNVAEPAVILFWAPELYVILKSLLSTVVVIVLTSWWCAVASVWSNRYSKEAQLLTTQVYISIVMVVIVQVFMTFGISKFAFWYRCFVTPKYNMY